MQCGMPIVCSTHEHWSFSISEVTDTREKAGSVLGVVHPLTGSWSLSIICKMPAQSPGSWPEPSEGPLIFILFQLGVTSCPSY